MKLNALLTALSTISSVCIALNSVVSAKQNSELVGFATLEGYGRNGTNGGEGGEHRQVTTLDEFIDATKGDAPRLVELMNDIDCSSLDNQAAGSPPDFKTGRVYLGSNKTIYSRNGKAAIHRGTLEIRRKQNVIIRNLNFRDLWVLDPTGKYDRWGWDYVVIDESHHVWVDHCNFDRAYDGMIDIKKGSDLVTLSWNVFRDQKKCMLVGHSDSKTAESLDQGKLSVTFHHNWFDRIEERIPRMRFGNAHVFNNLVTELNGKGIQSTSGAASLVENCVFAKPTARAMPTVEENDGPSGTIKVINCVIEGAASSKTVFREFGEKEFAFNEPYRKNVPPYHYVLDPVTEVTTIVMQGAGAGKLELP
ncbi:MAG: hypothetical protein SGI77_02230 [Pirellulaceae bacterium]|nr:hypothetical protein [Pirellulaceae bacterium]